MSELGRIAYEAFNRQAGNLAPFWPEVPEPVRVMWDAAADAVAQAQIETDLNAGDLPGGF